MANQEVRPGQVIIFAGAFIAFLVGSGFATGQEIMQYFVSYGFMGMAGAAVVFILFLYVGVSFITVGYEQRFPKGSDVYTYYCGRYVGKFYDYFSIAFIFMSFVVMVGGAGATLKQQYGLPVSIGGIGLAVIAGATVLFGLKKIVDVIGVIGPVICVMAIALGLAAIAMNPDGLARASEIIPKMNLLKASGHWMLAALSYVGFCMLWLAAFMSQMGKTARSKKEASLGAIFGALGFTLAVVIMALGIMANVEQAAGSLVPSLVLAGNIHPVVAIIFSLTISLAIFSTSVPLLWMVASRMANEESKTFKVLTIILAAIGAFIGLRVPFDRLVNIIYVINGYVGILLLVLMIVKTLRGHTPSRALQTS